MPQDGHTDGARRRRPNRLAREKSPYLLQHAYNPVDWFPWGAEAFEKARREDKPVFLSIGYSSCHWCHVMEAESFEDPATAEVLNDGFVSIKVDREERPDIDEVYMSATQLVTGRGGWPNSLWLTPDGRPWHAATYVPREDRPGRPGFISMLRILGDVWRDKRADVEAQAGELTAEAGRLCAGEAFGPAMSAGADIVSAAVEDLKESFDTLYGGFGGAPKFPPHGALRLLLHEWRRTGEKRLSDVAVKTLDAMAAGGIHDVLGGGFHRYSTDAHWLLPHFEKMLYDNAQLGRIYAEAYRLTANAWYGEVARGVFDWALREMLSPEGAFHSAIDADSEGEEGKFYLWSYGEIIDALGEDDGRFFARVYGVRAEGNFREESTGLLTGTNVLYRQEDLHTAAARFGAGEESLMRRLAADRSRLMPVREARVRPRTDDKVIAGWNGLMMGALAYAGGALTESRYTQAARQCARFVTSRMSGPGGLRRAFRDGQAYGPAVLDDYAAVAEGLLELHAATGDTSHLDAARGLADEMLRLFADGEGGFFLTSGEAADLIVRPKVFFDQATPSGQATAAGLLTRLSGLTGEERYREAARRTLEACAEAMQKSPGGTHYMALALAESLER